ncbi:MAG: 16S rRNA (cytosine(1402)-N(4))-methyltransferase RsmH [Hyphomicrobiaceae bacterium]|nr:16S rRNA (cytosine(1402)-N(4))-methyltransferase RsmH [Hyphomicrobiaceae bacterium]
MAGRGTRGGLGPARGEATDRIRHTPVLLQPVVEHLRPEDGAVCIDATFGAGGYTRAILAAARCRVLAIDRDPAAVAGGADLAAAHPGRLDIRQGRFSELEAIAADAGLTAVDGVVFDLGVSSMQLDEPERGFSFQSDGPLDMRMSRTGLTAADLVNTLGEGEIADILFHFGEERRSRAIARAIVRARAREPLTRTLELARVVAQMFGGRKIEGRHPATRTFQALRIAVNDELGEVAAGLSAAERLLRPGGRLVAVTFHSLEDRIVKRFLAERAGRTSGTSRHLPEIVRRRAASFRIVNHRPVSPDEEEIAANPRARSAKLRAGERTEASSWPLDPAALGVPQIAR